MDFFALLNCKFTLIFTNSDNFFFEFLTLFYKRVLNKQLQADNFIRAIREEEKRGVISWVYLWQF